MRLRIAGESRNAHQSVTLLEAIEEFGFDALIGGARRDEEKARAKERIFSFRDSFGQWDPKNQRPELWTLFNARVHPGEHMRVFPISQLDRARRLAVHRARAARRCRRIYYAHQREVVRAPRPAGAGDRRSRRRATARRSRRVSVRFRTVGDITCTCPVESDAADAADDRRRDAARSTITERGATRMDDQTSDASMERRKKEGYF